MDLRFPKKQDFDTLFYVKKVKYTSKIMLLNYHLITIYFYSKEDYFIEEKCPVVLDKKMKTHDGRR